MYILIIVAIMVISLLLLFIYSACVVSSRCSRIEENNYKEVNNEYKSYRNIWFRK